MKSSRARVISATIAAAVIAIAVPALAADAGFYAESVSGWHNSANPSSTTASIPVGGSISWENRDPDYAHPVECVQTQSNATCPWSGAKELPPKPTFGNPASVSATFPKSGTFAFRCAVHPTMKGTVVVGSGKPAATATPTPSATQTTKSSVRASVQPTASASTSTQPKATHKTTKKKSKARSSVLAAPSVLGKRVDSSSSTGGGRTGGIILAIVLILGVGAGHMTVRNQGLD